ncbi:MAG: hypothetical protein OCC49_14820 [Fibrobacterales bacterium]
MLIALICICASISFSQEAIDSEYYNIDSIIKRQNLTLTSIKAKTPTIKCSKKEESNFWITGLILPFLVTVGASMTILIINKINTTRAEIQKKLYTLNYMMNACDKILHAELIVLNHTINPHLDATQQILKGNSELKHTMFVSGEFNILTDKPISFSGITEENKTLVGYDKIGVIHSYDVLIHNLTNDNDRIALNKFVENCLSSELAFDQYLPEVQKDLLNQYWDHLDRIKHNSERNIFFIHYIITRFVMDYLKDKQFKSYKKDEIYNTIHQTKLLANQYKDLIPDADFMEKVKNGGIQNAI